MNRLVLALALLLATPIIAGCIGYPPDAARPGDLVEVRYDAYDLETGEAVATNATATLDIGGPSVLGRHVASAIVGKRAGETIQVESRDDPGRGFTNTVAVRSELARVSAHEEVSAASFQAVVGKAEVGMEFDYPGGPMRGRVTAANGTTVAFDLLLPTDPTVEHAQWGIQEVYTRQGDEVVIHVEPFGTPVVFKGPLGEFLPQPGMYRVRGMDGANITFDHSPIQDAKMLERDLRFEVTVLRVRHGEVVPAASGEYGHRLSPHLGGGANHPGLAGH